MRCIIEKLRTDLSFLESWNTFAWNWCINWFLCGSSYGDLMKHISISCLSISDVVCLHIFLVKLLRRSFWDIEIGPYNLGVQIVSVNLSLHYNGVILSGIWYPRRIGCHLSTFLTLLSIGNLCLHSFHLVPNVPL